MLKHTLAKAAVATAAIASLSACTPGQINAWHHWHRKDPAAAEAFARQPAIQAQLGSRTVVRQSNTATGNSSSVGRSGVNWDAVARCESGGQWSHGLVTNHVGTFSGGLMIMQSAWRQYGGTQFAPHAGAASRAEQIIVAERIAARVGAARAWQCPV